MSPHRRHQLASVAPIVSALVCVGGAVASVTGALWVKPARLEAAAAEQQKSLEQFKADTRAQIADLERARREDHELLIRIAADMAWVRQALEKTKP